MNVIRRTIRRIKLSHLLIALPIALIFNQWSNFELNQWYAASRFPVPYAEGQLSFSADKLTSYYAYMTDHGTLDTYLRTQLFDFVFILSTMMLHVVAALLVYKLVEDSKVLRRLSIVALIAGFLAPCFDVLENVVSFFFIAEPEHIRNVPALVYSSFSAAKFGLFGITYVLCGLLFVWWAISAARRSFVRP